MIRHSYLKFQPFINRKAWVSKIFINPYNLICSLNSSIILSSYVFFRKFIQRVNILDDEPRIFENLY